MTSLMARDTSALAGSAYANSGRALTTLGQAENQVTAEASVSGGDAGLSEREKSGKDCVTAWTEGCVAIRP